jgi:ABC-2 type transport system permease protein
MNTQSNAMYESPPNSPRITPAVSLATRPMYWSVRRELWENRSIYIAPLAVAAVFLFGFSISSAMGTLDLAPQNEAAGRPYDIAALLIMGTALIVGVFYCLEALHGERRDRSILFWKSMPVSDLTTVLSKASIPIVIIPLVSCAITVATWWIMLLLSSAVLLGRGLSAATLWTQVPIVQISLMLLYHLVAIHGLWYAPLYAWLLLVSSWARRAAFLWAALPLLAIGVVEKIAFNTSYLAAMLRDRLTGGPKGVPFTTGNMAMDPMMHLNPGPLLISPGLWIGLAVAAVFLAAAVRIRRYRGPI